MSKRDAHLNRGPKIVVIGGGTGSFTLLSCLKNYARDITALVNMADDGGSTGVLRDELGVLPPGDVRQCLVALSESTQTMRELFNYRFPEGTFKGHSFGNLFLSAVEKMSDNFVEAVDLASEVLKISGKVVPVSLEECRLVLTLPNGKKIEGESAIGEHGFKPGEHPKLSLQNSAHMNPAAAEAIKEADIVVIAPGGIYTSLIPALLVNGMTEALQETTAKIVYVCNLINKPHQTKDFGVHDYAAELERFMGERTLDYVLYNSLKPSPKTLNAYALKGEYPVLVDKKKLDSASYHAVGGKFLSRSPQKRNPNDSFIERSLIRHDADAVSRALMRIHYT